MNDSPVKSQFDLEKSEPEESSQKNNTIIDTNEIIAETEKLLKETERLTSMDIIEESITDDTNTSKDLKTSLSDKMSEPDKDARSSDVEINELPDKTQKEKDILDVDHEKLNASDKDDKKSLLSCFDFHEEEPSVPPVRKKSRRIPPEEGNYKGILK